MDIRRFAWIIFVFGVMFASATSQVQHQQMDILKIVRQSKVPPKDEKMKTWVVYPHPSTSKEKLQNRTSPYMFNAETNGASWWQQFKAFSRRSSLLDFSQAPVVKNMSPSDRQDPPDGHMVSGDMDAPAYPYFIQDIERFILRDSIIDDPHLSSSKKRSPKVEPDDITPSPTYIPIIADTKPHVQYVTPGVQYAMSDVRYIKPEVEYVTELMEMDEVPEVSNSSSVESRVEYVEPAVEYSMHDRNANKSAIANYFSNMLLGKSIEDDGGQMTTETASFSMTPTTPFYQNFREKENESSSGRPGIQTDPPRGIGYGKRRHPKKSSGRRSAAAKLVKNLAVRGRMSRRIDSNSLSDSVDTSIPGIPDEDYPTLKSIPITDFRCANENKFGYYADVDTKCQAFHICHANGMDTFICPVGTMFNQQHLVCDWWYNVECEESQKYYKLQDVYDDVDSDDPGVESSSNSARSVSADKDVNQNLHEFQFDDENLEEYLELQENAHANLDLGPQRSGQEVEDTSNNKTLERNTYFGGSKPFFHFADQNDVRKNLPVARSLEKMRINNYVTITSPYRSLTTDNTLFQNPITTDTNLPSLRSSFGGRQTKPLKEKGAVYTVKKKSKTGWWGRAFELPFQIQSKSQKVNTTPKPDVKNGDAMRNVKRYIILRPRHLLQNGSFRGNYPRSEISKSDTLVQESIVKPVEKRGIPKFNNIYPNSWKVVTENPPETKVTTLRPTTWYPSALKYDDPFIIYLDNDKKLLTDIKKPGHTENKTLKMSRKNILRRPKFGDRIERKSKRYFQDSKTHVTNYSPYSEEESVAKNIYSKAQTINTKVEKVNHATEVKVANPPEFETHSLDDIKPVISNLRTDLRRMPKSQVTRFGDPGDKVVVRLGDTVTISESQVTKIPKNLFAVAGHKKKKTIPYEHKSNTSNIDDQNFPVTSRNSSNYTVSVRVESKLLPSPATATRNKTSTVYYANYTTPMNRYKPNSTQLETDPAYKPQILYYDELKKLRNISSHISPNSTGSQGFSKIVNRHGGFTITKNDRATDKGFLPRLELSENKPPKTNSSSTKLKLNLPKIYAFFPNDLITRNVTNDFLPKTDDKLQNSTSV